MPPMLLLLTCMEKRRLAALNDFLDGKELREQPEMHMKETLLY
jgi:hypothetical protein